ncbi:aminotransferase class IV [bacterium]|nr:aminotransferase class IV [bacterium]
MNIICLNGEFIELEEAHISPTDAGFMHGHGVFETMRAEEGILLHAADHFARLARGARVLEIPFHFAPEELLALCQQVLDANGLEEARLRLTLTAGPLRGQPIASREGEPTLAITATALDDSLDDTRDRGWRAVTVPIPRNHRSPLATIKSTNYLDSILAKRMARQAGFDEAILLNTAGLLAEGSMTNLFVVRGERVLTPPISDGALPGIQRSRIAGLAGACGFDFAEESLTADALVSADEAFLTNAVIEIMPLVAIGQHEINDGQPGEATEALYTAHRYDIEGLLDQSRH